VLAAQPQAGSSQQPQLASQQLSPQQLSAHPQLDSQQLFFLANRRLRKQPFLQQQLLEAQPHEASQQLSLPQQASSPQQSSGQPHEASSQQPLSPQQSSPQQASSPQQSSAQPQLLSQQESFLNRFKRQQPFFLQQLSAQPQDASQHESLPQHESSPQQGSSQQPHDFSQQHDGSALSQPQPLLSIRSSKPAPKLWPARQRLITSAPMTFFIEPPLLCVGVNSRDDLMRRRGSAAALPGIACRGDRGAAWGEPRKSCSGRELSNRRGRRGTKAGGRDPFEPKGRRLASRANPWLDQ
jgi:hypothetical protein